MVVHGRRWQRHTWHKASDRRPGLFPCDLKLISRSLTSLTIACVTESLFQTLSGGNLGLNKCVEAHRCSPGSRPIRVFVGTRGPGGPTWRGTKRCTYAGTNPSPLSLPLSLSLSLPSSLIHSLTHSLSLTHTHTHTHTLSLSLSLGRFNVTDMETRVVDGFNAYFFRMEVVEEDAAAFQQAPTQQNNDDIQYTNTAILQCYTFVVYVQYNT